MKKNINIFIGSVILACGLHFFLLQNNISAGGVSGLSLVLSKVTGINLGVLNLILNVIVLILGVIFVNVDFTKKSILSAATVSVVLIVLEKCLPQKALTEEIMLNVIFGPLLAAIGIGIIFYNGGSSGGTDVIAAIINKYTNFPIHISLFITDFIVVLSSTFVIGLDKGLFAILVIMIQDITIDYVIQGLGRKIAIFVISDKYEEINNLLIKKHDRGVTLIHAEGGYTGREKRLVFTICATRKYPIIKDDILSVDNRAFIFSHTISEVFGEGFTIKELR